MAAKPEKFPSSRAIFVMLSQLERSVKAAETLEAMIQRNNSDESLMDNRSHLSHHRAKCKLKHRCWLINSLIIQRLREIRLLFQKEKKEDEKREKIFHAIDNIVRAAYRLDLVNLSLCGPEWEQVVAAMETENEKRDRKRIRKLWRAREKNGRCCECSERAAVSSSSCGGSSNSNNNGDDNDSVKNVKIHRKKDSSNDYREDERLTLKTIASSRGSSSTKRKCALEYCDRFFSESSSSSSSSQLVFCACQQRIWCSTECCELEKQFFSTFSS